MKQAFTVDFIEQKKELFFVAGISRSPLALGDSFTALFQYGKAKNSQEAKGTIGLKIESILQNGEPVDSLKANEAAMLVLSGEGQALMDAAMALQWAKKSGRLMRNSEAALSLEAGE